MKDQRQIEPPEALNRALSGLSRSGVPVQPAGQEEPVCHVREALMDEILAEHPGLTRNKLSNQMAEMGF